MPSWSEESGGNLKVCVKKVSRGREVGGFCGRSFPMQCLLNQFSSLPFLLHSWTEVTFKEGDMCQSVMVSSGNSVKGQHWRYGFSH